MASAYSKMIATVKSWWHLQPIWLLCTALVQGCGHERYNLLKMAAALLVCTCQIEESQVFITSCSLFFIYANSKVHPDSSDIFLDEEKADLGTEATAMDGANHSPSRLPPSGVVTAGTAAGGNTSVKKLFKKGSVELKPMGNPVLPPINKCKFHHMSTNL